MSRWFRFYDDAVNDPKVLRLSAESFRNWMFLLCVASKCGGRLPSTGDIAFYLRIKPPRAAVLIAELVGAGLLDKVEDTFEPHNWFGRQYQSDSSKARVQRHRDKRAAAGLIPQWTAPAALRRAVYDADNYECVYCGSAEFLSLDHRTSELNGGTHDFENLVTACRSCNGAKRDLSFDEYVTKTNIETLHGRFQQRPQTTDNRTEPEHRPERKTRACALAEPWSESDRDRFWAEFPNKVGKADAMKAFGKASRKTTPDVLFPALQRYATKTDDRPFCNPSTWLNQERWLDQPAIPTNGRRTVQDAARDFHEKTLQLAASFDEPAPGGLRGGEGADVVRLLPPR